MPDLRGHRAAATGSRPDLYFYIETRGLWVIHSVCRIFFSYKLHCTRFLE